MPAHNVLTQSKKKKALDLARSNRLDEARALYAEVCAKDKSDAESWFMLGSINGQLGLFEDAERCLRQTITLQPSAEAFDNLGLALQQQGRLDEAMKCYQQALKLNPRYLRARFNLGGVCHLLGKHDVAIECYRQVIREQPGSLEAQGNLGALLMERGNYAEALSCFQQVLRVNPNVAEIHNQIGVSYQRLNQPGKAVEAFQQATRLKQDYAEAWSNLGDALLNLQKFEHALTTYQQALRYAPDNPGLLARIGEVLHYFGRLSEAEKHLQRAIQLAPESAKAHLILGEVLINVARFDEAAECFKQVIRIAPGDSEAVVALAKMYERQGDPARSYEILRPLLETGADSCALGAVYCTISPKINRQKEAMAHAERLLRRADNPSAELQQLYFCLGKAYESLADYDRSFEHYYRANEIISFDYRPEEFTRKIDNIISAYSARFMASAPRARVCSDRPVFVVGMPRSGTSLVEQILASHPQVYGAGELLDIQNIVDDLPLRIGADPSGADWVNLLNSEILDSCAQRYLDRLAGFSKDARRVTDKLPHNFMHLGPIELIFPTARIIHCDRDPLDTCLSCYFQEFGGKHTYTTKLPWLGHHYREYTRLMAHWRSLVTLPMLEVQYEDLIAEPDHWIRKIVEFCGLEWDDRCLRFYELERPVRTLSYDQVRRPMYKTSAGRWRRYEKHLGPLLKALEDN